MSFKNDESQNQSEKVVNLRLRSTIITYLMKKKSRFTVYNFNELKHSN